MSTKIRCSVLLLAIAASLSFVPAVSAGQEGEIASARAGGHLIDVGRELRRQPLVEDALRQHGMRPDRLGRAEERALGETFAALFPEADARWYRLNRTQAAALVYMALGQPGRSGESRRTSRRAACESAAELVGELDDLFGAPRRGQSRLLLPAEQQRIRAQAREILRLSDACGERRLTDATIDLIDLVSDQRAERERVARQVSRLRSLARLAVVSR
jgi:hypothetical protein